MELRADGKVTLEAMELALQMLADDPDNAAAQAVLEKGAKSLDAQTQLIQARFNNSFENLPDDVREGALAAMDEARYDAYNGAVTNNSDEEIDPTASAVKAEQAAMKALECFIADNLDNAELSSQELAALRNAAGAAADFKAAAENADSGAEILKAAKEALANSDLAAMKADLAIKLGVSPDQLIVLSGTDTDETINITNGDDGGLCVTVGDTVYNYTAEEAKYLIIDSGAGDDVIKAADDVAQSLHIFGGAGNDRISGGAGDDLIYGGSGNDYLQGLAGNDMVSGGAGEDKIFGGNNYWDDYDADAADTPLEDDGNDILLGEDGNDYIDGGDGHDSLYGDYNVPHSDEEYYPSGNDIILGGKGDDLLNGGAGNDLLLGETGADILEGGRGSDLLDGGQDNDEDLVCGYGRCGVDPDSDSADLAITNNGY